MIRHSIDGPTSRALLDIYAVRQLVLFSVEEGPVEFLKLESFELWKKLGSRLTLSGEQVLELLMLDCMLRMPIRYLFMVVRKNLREEWRVYGDWLPI